MPNPLQGGVLGRTDEGVDISASPGAVGTDPVPGTSQFVGESSNWFAGQPYYLFKVLSGPFQGKFWYVAEQFRIGLRHGQQVTQGQKIGTYAASGTATEWGWGTSTPGDALAHSHYVEGQVTQEGTDFRNQIILGKGPGASGSSPSPSGGSGGNAPGITRPGGTAAGSSSSGGGDAQAVEDMLTNYTKLRDMPRQMPAAGPPGTVGAGLTKTGTTIGQSFQWWLANFNELAGKVFSGPGIGSSSSGTGSSGTSGSPSGGGPAWHVVASLESLGGTGSCGHAIQADGYSELSTVPMGTGSDFHALGGLACGTQLIITNPANGKSVTTGKQDVGAGSSFLPVMGLYPGTVSKLGLSGGEFHVIIARADGGNLKPVRGTPASAGTAGGKTGVNPSPTLTGRNPNSSGKGRRGGHF